MTNTKFDLNVYRTILRSSNCTIIMSNSTMMIPTMKIMAIRNRNLKSNTKKEMKKVKNMKVSSIQ